MGSQVRVLFIKMWLLNLSFCLSCGPPYVMASILHTLRKTLSWIIDDSTDLKVNNEYLK